MKVAVGYVRTSGKINPKSSIPNQIKLIQGYCERYQLYLKNIYTDDCKTGTKVEGRTQYQRLKAHISDQKDIDLILVAYADRLGREAYEFIQIVEDIKKYDIELISIAENLSSKQVTPIQLVMTAIQSELENKQRYQRIYDSKQEKVKKGMCPTIPPLGYKTDENRFLVIDEKTKDIVIDTYSLFAEGKTLGEIKKTLSERYSNFNRGEKNLRYILTNKTYTGYLYSRGKKDFSYTQLSEVPHPSLITVELFEKCLKRISSMQKFIGIRKPNKFFLLSRGLFQCPVCHSAITGRGEKYRCKMKCFISDVSELEGKIIRYLEMREQSNGVKDKLKTLLNQIQSKKEAVEVRFAKGQINIQELKKHLTKIENDMLSLMKEREGKFAKNYTQYIFKKDFKMLKQCLREDQVIFTFDELNNVALLKED